MAAINKVAATADETGLHWNEYLWDRARKEHAEAEARGEKISLYDVVRNIQRSKDINEEYLAYREDVAEQWREDMQRFGAYSSVYSLTDRILTNQDVDVIAVNDKNNEAPAQTDGKTIQFNFAKINGEFGSDEFLLGLHGLNHHEVAHLLWTPRKGSKLIKWAVENRVMKAFNLLEDNRIESFMVAKYPSTKAFLTASALQQIVDHPVNAGSRAFLFPILCGRKYLDLSLRQELATMFAAYMGKDLTRKVQELVDTYVTLSLPSDESQARTIIMEFAKELDIWDDPTMGSSNQPAGENGEDGDSEPDTRSSRNGNNRYRKGCAERTPMSAGRIESSKNQQALANKIAEQGPSVDMSDEALAKHEQVTDRESAEDKLGQAAEELMQEVAQQESVAQELNQTRKALRQGQRALHTLSKTKGDERTVTAEMRLTARQFADELIQAEIDADPTWVSEQPSGRLNLQRAIRGDVNSINTLFDRWSDGDQSTEIEASILIDNSGSMSRIMDETNEAAWIIKRAIEAIEGKVSTFTFSTYCKRLYDRDERAMPTTYRGVRAQNSTNPQSALVETSLIMEASTAANKLVFILTDGSWDSSTSCDEEIRRMQEAGVLVVVVFMTGVPQKWSPEAGMWVPAEKPAKSTYKGYAHGADVFEVVYAPRELIAVARSVVTSVLDKQYA